MLEYKWNIWVRRVRIRLKDICIRSNPTSFRACYCHVVQAQSPHFIANQKENSTGLIARPRRHQQQYWADDFNWMFKEQSAPALAIHDFTQVNDFHTPGSMTALTSRASVMYFTTTIEDGTYLRPCSSAEKLCLDVL